MTVPRETGFGPLVALSLSAALAWMLVLVLFGLTVTSQDGKAGVSLVLVVIAFLGSVLGTLARLDRLPLAGLALGVNLALDVFSVLGTVAVLS